MVTAVAGRGQSGWRTDEAATRIQPAAVYAVFTVVKNSAA